MNPARIVYGMLLWSALSVTCSAYRDLQMTGDENRINYYQSDGYPGGATSNAEEDPGSVWAESNYPNSEYYLAYLGNNWVQRSYYYWTWYGGSSSTWTWSYSPVFRAYGSNVILIYRSSDCVLTFTAHGYMLGGGTWVLEYAN